MYYVVYVTCKNMTEGRKITKKLLEDKLAACVNLFNDIESMYWWRGKIQYGTEAFLIIKTKKSCYKKLVKEVKAIHSYSNPEIIALPISEGDKDYLGWIDDCCK